MYFNNITDFFHMGGYAAYVWPAYGIVFFVLFFNIISAIKQKQKILKKLRRSLNPEDKDLNAASLLE